MIQPPVWTEAELEESREGAESAFRDARRSESMEVYLRYFDEYRAIVEQVLDRTLNLTRLDQAVSASQVGDRESEVLRYFCGPPLSLDDLRMLANAESLHSQDRGPTGAVSARVIGIIREWCDRRRFPWLDVGRPPTEHEKSTAIVATTALLAMRRTETYRRMRGSEAQERLVRDALFGIGFREAVPRRVPTLSLAPPSGEFCREAMLGSRKADFIIGLADGRTAAIECKVSSSAVNSIKRLNNDAAVKAAVWRSEFGTVQVVPIAVLEGVFALRNLSAAQNQGLTIFWAHDLAGMTDWIQEIQARD